MPGERTRRRVSVVTADTCDRPLAVSLFVRLTTATMVACSMCHCLRPSQLFLGLSTLFTVIGVLHMVFPEYAFSLQKLDVNLLKNEVANVLCRSYGYASH